MRILTFKFFASIVLLTCAMQARAENIYLVGDSVFSTRSDLNPLVAQYIGGDTGATVINYAVGGSTTADVLTWIASSGCCVTANAAAGSVTFLSVGGNDMMNGVPRATIISNLELIIQKIEYTGTRVVLVGMPTLQANRYINQPDANGNLQWLVIDPMYTAYPNAAHPNVVVTDFVSSLERIPGFVHPDLIHLNNNGFATLDHAFAQTYNQIKGRPYSQPSTSDVLSFISTAPLSQYATSIICSYLHLNPLLYANANFGPTQSWPWI